LASGRNNTISIPTVNKAKAIVATSNVIRGEFIKGRTTTRSMINPRMTAARTPAGSATQ
jgi:hypothetical protein